jgi:hypothetical protein
MRSPYCVSVYPPYQLLNAWTNISETWYVYHGTWAHLNGVLHKSLPSVCVPACVSPIVATLRPVKKFTAAKNKKVTEELLSA